MKQKNSQQLKRVSPVRNKTESSPLLSPQLEQKIVHLQTLLMLSQLNSTYYQFNLNLHKATKKIDKVYFKTKIHAFLSIQNYRHDLLEVKANRDCFEITQDKKRMAKISDDIDMNFEEDDLPLKFEKYKKTADYQQIAVNSFVKCQYKLSRFTKLLLLKTKGIMSFAFYRLQHNRETINQIYSEKSSKIETNDSQKSKIFRRSVEKRDNRKSFSLQKSGLSSMHEQLYVPVKYQPSRVSSQLSINSEERVPSPDNQHISSMLNRFLHKVGDKSKERRNNLQINREKKESKCSSAKKYNTTLLNQERQEKINELQYLKRKYKKLIDQFSWFSQRFLKVIQEEEYVQ